MINIRTATLVDGAAFAGWLLCFVVASLPGFVQLWGSRRVAGVVYFVGSIQFTVWQPQSSGC